MENLYKALAASRKTASRQCYYIYEILELIPLGYFLISFFRNERRLGCQMCYSVCPQKHYGRL